MTDKQKKFVDEYLIDLNATQAAIRAGYSPKTANEQGARLLTNVSVQRYLEQKQAVIARRTGISQDRVVRELAKIAFVNINNICTSNGRIKADATDDDLSCIESIKVKQSESDTGSSEEREVKLCSKLKALELLGKHLGMWNDKVDLNLNVPVVFQGEDDLE